MTGCSPLCQLFIDVQGYNPLALQVYEAKLADFGIAAEELGFRPLITNTSTAPAGLVVGA